MWRSFLPFGAIQSKHLTRFGIFCRFRSLCTYTCAPYFGYNKFDWRTLILRSNWTCRIWIGILSSRLFCIVCQNLRIFFHFQIITFYNVHMECIKDLLWLVYVTGVCTNQSPHFWRHCHRCNYNCEKLYCTHRDSNSGPLLYETSAFPYDLKGIPPAESVSSEWFVQTPVTITELIIQCDQFISFCD